MKNLLFILLTLFLFSCSHKKEVYETEFKTYIISHKEGNKPLDNHYLYLQTPISTEKIEVTYNTYNEYQVGDTIQVMIKYWEKSKNL